MFNYICQLLYTRWPKSPTPNKYKKDFLFKNKNVIVLGFSWTWNKNPSLVKTGEVQLIHIDGKRRSSSTKRSPYVGVLQHKKLLHIWTFCYSKNTHGSNGWDKQLGAWALASIFWLYFLLQKRFAHLRAQSCGIKSNIRKCYFFMREYANEQ